MSNFLHRYDTWHEFVTTLQTCQPTKGANKASRRTNDPTWHGTRTYEEALEYLRTGWHYGLDKMRSIQRNTPSNLFDAIMPVEEYKEQLQHTIAGGTIDVASHITGATPEVFLAEKTPTEETREIVHGRKLVTVYFNISNSSFTIEDAFFYRGAYCYSMIEHLENCGFSVELWTVEYVSNYGDVQRIYVKVKEFGELFDINKLNIALCSPFMLRRFMFALQESYPQKEEIDFTIMAYGSPLAGTLGELTLSEDVDTKPLLVNLVNVTTQEQALKKFKEVINIFTDTIPQPQ